MTKEEAKEILISTLREINSDEQNISCSSEEFTEAMLLAIDVLSKSSLPSNLEEAAKNYASDYTKNDNGNGGNDWEDDIKITFQAGAEWMAKQGETYDCRVLLNGVSQYKIVQHTVESFEPDEVVTVQIRKKD